MIEPSSLGEPDDFGLLGGDRQDHDLLLAGEGGALGRRRARPRPGVGGGGGSSVPSDLHALEEQLDARGG